MSAFEKAMNEYLVHFGKPYPYAVGIGFPGITDEENIKIIRECISTNQPVQFDPLYLDDVDY